MKVKCYVQTILTREVEIDDKFKILAVEKPWEHNIPDALYEEAVQAVEKATGIKMDDNCNDSAWICSVEDCETENLILEL
jgi:hypothetical protein